MIERLPFGMVNCYLIGTEKAAVLIDTAGEESGEDLYQKVKNRNVKLIVLTHGHNDHIGSAAFLSQKLGVPIGMHALDQELVSDNNLQPLFFHTSSGKFVYNMSQPALNYKAKQFFPSLLLKDGDTLNDFGVDAAIIELHGHTKGSIGIAFENSLIAGDAMFHLFGASGARLYTDLQKANESFERILNGGFQTVFVGHGKPISKKQVLKIAKKQNQKTAK